MAYVFFLQVLGPPREGNSDDIVRDIFRAAREGGAETLDVNRVADLPPDERGHAAFSGIGHRLVPLKRLSFYHTRGV